MFSLRFELLTMKTCTPIIDEERILDWDVHNCECCSQWFDEHDMHKEEGAWYCEDCMARMDAERRDYDDKTYEYNHR